MIQFYTLTEDHQIVKCDDVVKWAEWMMDKPKERRVGLTKVGDASVSTVFVGVDMFGEQRWFETALFNPDGSIYQTMSTNTWDEAVAMHAEMVETLKSLGYGEEE